MTKYTRHQKLPAQEATWKWEYLHRKLSHGENITKYTEQALVTEVTEQLVASHDNPELVEAWIMNHLNPKLVVKISQAIRRKRKRYFDNEKIFSSKKMVELDYEAWSLLSTYSKSKNVSLSRAVVELMDLLGELQVADLRQQAKIELLGSAEALIPEGQITLVGALFPRAQQQLIQEIVVNTTADNEPAIVITQSENNNKNS